MVKAGTIAGFALLLLLAGCFDVRSQDPGIEVLPDSLGRVIPTSNELGISGYWYAYGDQYDYPSRCTTIGLHSPDQCSRIDTPDALPKLGFYNSNGKMCTAGQVAMVINCPPGAGIGCESGGPDYSNIWGAGIGLDFGLEVAGGDNPTAFLRLPIMRQAWDPTTHHVAGVSFDLNWFSKDAPHMRVEFPFILSKTTRLPSGKGTVGLVPGVPPVLADTMGGVLPDDPPPSEEYPSGSPIWGVTGGQWSDDRVSPVSEGHNEVRFDSLGPPPETNYTWDVHELLGIQFHISTMKARPIEYGFCISNLAFLRD